MTAMEMLARKQI